MGMEYGKFLDELERFGVGIGIDPTNRRVMAYIEGCMENVRCAITVNSPALQSLPTGVPLTGDLVIDGKTAKDALERIDDDFREERAAINLLTILNEHERMTYEELLSSFATNKGDKQSAYDFVMQRPYMRDVSASSPLYALVQCILRRQDNYTAVIEQELADHQIELQDSPHPPVAAAIIRKFRELLTSCL